MWSEVQESEWGQPLICAGTADDTVMRSPGRAATVPCSPLPLGDGDTKLRFSWVTYYVCL